MSRPHPEPISRPSSAPDRRGIDVGLWVGQGLLALTFVGTATWKLATPIDELAAMIPWAGQVPPSFLYMTAAFDLLGGVGVLLPSLTRVRPRLTVWAAIGCALLQLSAIAFHLSRGEGSNTPFNGLLVGLSLFVAWGRHRRAPIPPRS